MRHARPCLQFLGLPLLTAALAAGRTGEEALLGESAAADSVESVTVSAALGLVVVRANGTGPDGAVPVVTAWRFR